MESVRFRLRGSHALRPAFPCRSAARRFSQNSTGHPHAALQPRQRRFGLLPFRSPLLRESLLISFPGLLRWFTSPSLTSGSYLCSLPGSGRLRPGVTPFGYPRLSGYVPLPAAFRSLSRPSSPYGSKASTLRFLSLGHIASPAIILKKTPATPPSGGKARFPSPFPLLSKNRHLYEDLISIQIFMGQIRVELMTPALSERCSNQLSYCPDTHAAFTARGREETHAGRTHGAVHRRHLPFSQKGGDPAAPSGTTTLLRLHPPHGTCLRRRTLSRVILPASGIPHSDGVTGGVYKARERIHRAVLMRDY